MGMQLANDIVAAGLAPDVGAAVASVVEQTPLGRLGEVGDMADAAVFLCSNEARFHHWCRPAGRRRHGHVNRQTQRTEIREDINMSEKKPVIVYGVSGYTGVWFVNICGNTTFPLLLPAATRPKEGRCRKIPGIETADYEVAELSTRSKR